MDITAAVSHGPTSLFDLEDVTIAEPLPDELRVRMVATGICHTDLTLKSISAENAPAVFGHEGAGIVDAVGSAVTDVKVGDHVVLGFSSCGACGACSDGQKAYCHQFGALNVAGRRPDGSAVLSQDGSPVWSSFFGQSSFATHAVINRRSAVVVDSDVDLTACAPMGCGFLTGAGAVVNVLRPNSDSTFAVFGTGGVGMAAIMAAAALEVRTIIAVDLSAERREVALQVGATHAIDGASEALRDEIRELTRGGVTHGLDTTAVPSVIRTAALALGSRGQLAVVGVGLPDVAIDISDLISNGKSIRGSIEGDSDPAQLIPLLLRWQREGKFPVDKVITTYPFAQINEAVASATGPVVKAVLKF
ncbi:NAD(P)-dependent alcohol dehydrogenase [Nocardia vinacea]|uniref:NAD(P)-dependent alcohol dehydrogenase n=1 Tax=Nocardia vinacea TaxID=96468 RepID=UPI0033DFCB7C